MTRSPVQSLRILALSPVAIAWIWIERQGSLPWVSPLLGLPWLDFGTDHSDQILWNSGLLIIFLALEFLAARLKNSVTLPLILQVLTPCLPTFLWFPTTQFLWSVDPFGRPDLALMTSVVLFWGILLWVALRKQSFSSRQMMLLWLIGGFLTPFLSYDRAIWILAWVPFFPARISPLRKSVFQLDSEIKPARG